MAEALVIQMPSGPAPQLVLLFHGVGAAPEDMLPIGERLAHEFPQAAIVSVPGRHASDFGRGYQWFSVSGISEADRPRRVAEAMPEFIAAVRHWQAKAGAGVDETALIGFSQGAIMALEATQRPEPLAGRVVALSGRFAAEPALAPPATTLHFVHGKADEVIHYGHAVRAAERLVALGADVTADVIPFLGHAVNGEVLELMVERLTGYLPQRKWREAIRSVPPA